MKAESKSKLPPRIDLGAQREYAVQHAIPTMGGARFAGKGERVLNFVLPPFQRPAVWKRPQQIRFVESLILAIPVGSYTYVRCDDIDTPDGERDGWLIDGQQRMRAIAAFLASEIEVFGVRWKDLGEADRFRFASRGFPAYELRDVSEDECLAHYLRLNYGGTAHTAADRRRAVATKRPRKS